MNSLEPQLSEDLSATVRAPADWPAMQREYHTRRRVTARDAIELAIVLMVSAAIAWWI